MDRAVRKQLRDAGSVKELFTILEQHYDLEAPKDRKIIHKIASYLPDFIRMAEAKEKVHA